MNALSSSLSSPISRALVTHVCRRVDKLQLTDGLALPSGLASGQIALAEVLRSDSQETVVLADGMAHRLRPGTQLLVALGEARSALGRSGSLPQAEGAFELLTPHGLAGTETTRGARLGAPLPLRLLGLAQKHDRSVATLADFAESPRGLRDQPRTYLMLGCSHRVGETQTLLAWTEGLSLQEGPGDLAVILLGDWPVHDLPAHLLDAGATHVLDASDLGLAQTHDLEGEALITALDDLRTLAGLRGVRRCLIALGGGYTRPEVQRLLGTGKLPARIDGVMLAAADALSARSVAFELQAHGLPLLGLSGDLANSPLAIREAQPLDVPILPALNLAEPAALVSLVALQYSQGRARNGARHNPFN